MVRVCAWCRLFLGLKRPLDLWQITHGICPACADRVEMPDAVVLAPPPRQILIVGPGTVGQDAAGELIARAGQSLLVIADRRHSDRRGRAVRVPVDRRSGARRASPPPSWARGYVLIDPVVETDLAQLLGSAARL